MDVISKSAVVMSWLREPKKDGLNPSTVTIPIHFKQKKYRR
jgi:hypothetical protein